MIGGIDKVRAEFTRRRAEVVIPEFTQTLSETQLVDLIPAYDGWIIGDDPATAAVFQAGCSGRLRAAVKWGVGVDNVDFEGARAAGFDVANTPGMFAEEVSDVALGYLIGLARDLFLIDRKVRLGEWPKPVGVSLRGKSVALVGYGNIGQALARKLSPLGMRVIAFDPVVIAGTDISVETAVWPVRLEEADFVILTCAMTPANVRMIGKEAIAKMKRGVRIINVARGPLIDQPALAAALDCGHVSAAALDVFVSEPPASNDPLLRHPRCIFGSHNSSNTAEAVERTSLLAIKLLFERLDSPQTTPS